MIGTVRQLVLVAGLLLGTAPLVVASAQSPATPPLESGEVYINLADGCGIILFENELKDPTTRDDIAAMDEIAARYASYVWSGQCRNGLIHGVGLLGKPADLEASKGRSSREARYGRILRSRLNFDGPVARLTYQLNGKVVSRMDAPDPYVPYWGERNERTTSLRGPDGVVYYTFTSTCYLDRARFKSCGGEGYRVYGVGVIRTVDPAGNPIPSRDIKGETIWCPNPRTTAGCDAMWRRMTDASAVAIDAVVSEYDATVERLAKLNAGYDVAYAAAEAEKKEAARAAEEARQAKAKAEADQAAAKQAAAERAFQAGLTTLNAGQLYAQADRLQEEGKTAQARETLRALVSRFPNSPLASMAAQQMSALNPATAAGPAGGGQGAAPASARPGAAAGGGGTCAMSRAEASAKFDSELEGVQARHSKEMTKVSSLAGYQYVYAYSLEALRLLEPYRQCMGPDYEANRSYLIEVRDSAKTGCEQLSSTNTCPAGFP